MRFLPSFLSSFAITLNFDFYLFAIMDVLAAPEMYTQALEGQKKTLEAAQARRGQRPRDRKSKDELYRKFMFVLAMRADIKHDGVQMHTSFVPPAYAPCITPLDGLKPIFINCLQLETHHRGNYLLLRSMTPPSRMTALMVIVEDEHGDGSVLQLYQQEDEDVRPATSVIDVGTVIVVKEPYFKVMSDGDYGLRVDHLSDVLFLDEGDAKIPMSWRPRNTNVTSSAASFKAEGNLAIGKRLYWGAITLYMVHTELKKYKG